MTTRTDLLELINNGENSAVEFKREVIDNRALAKELVAFSNFSGGAVLLGVEDNGCISGIARSNLEERVMTACRDKIRPPIIPFFEVIRDVELGKDLAVVRIAPGLSVHSVWHNSGNTYFIRVGTRSREASLEELSRLFQQRGAFRAELRPVSPSARIPFCTAYSEFGRPQTLRFWTSFKVAFLGAVYRWPTGRKGLASIRVQAEDYMRGHFQTGFF